MGEADRSDMVERPDFGADTDPRFFNEDIAPTPLEKRTWDKWQIAALWVGMSVCVPTYMLASSLIGSGMDWKQAIGTVFLANLLVLIPMILNAHAGTKYGIPFPVYCRIAFGLVGANVPGIMRGLVACGWFGIQTWIGGKALYTLLIAIGLNLPPEDAYHPHPVQFLCFLLFWVLNMIIVWRGIDSIKTLEKYGAPFLLLIGATLLFWAYVKADGFGPMLSEPSKLRTWPEFWAAFAPGLTANVAFWATLSLNIPDFTRYARSQKDQMLGQAMGLPPTMTAFAFVGVAVTSATVVIFGQPVWDPIVLSGKVGQGNPVAVIISMLAFGVATLTTNLAANVVSPANDISHLAPRHISFRTGGMITGILGILVMPWKLLADPKAYVYTWLGGYGSLLGSIGGILLIEYWIIQRGHVELSELYREGGRYPRWRPSALIAFLLGAAPCVPGFLHSVDVYPGCPEFLVGLYGFSVFVSAGLAAIFYLLFNLSRMGKAGSGEL
jgi:NCS1 family nucleobase:cation symporter-1